MDAAGTQALSTRSLAVPRTISGGDQSSRAAWHAGAANGEKRRRFSGLLAQRMGAGEGLEIGWMGETGWQGIRHMMQELTLLER